MPPFLRDAGLILGALLCFAANSVLTRAGLADGETGPWAFTVIRLCAGAATLGLILAIRGDPGSMRREGSVFSGAMPLGYAAAFSAAYLFIDAGVGALILFGAVQVTMFAGGLIGGERPNAARWLGAAAAFGGLVYLVAPGSAAPPVIASALMAAAGLCWGIYSLRGRRAGAPTAANGAAFLLAAPVSIGLWGAFGPAEPVSMNGIWNAVASGAIASGGGYALWYAVLPRLEASLAAVAQLTVPLIALAGGVLFLGEPATARFAVSAAMILGGVAVATLLGRKRVNRG